MLNIVLLEPEIPPNTGNAMRLCANVGATLHLVEPLGFTLETKALRRAGLDYRDLAAVLVHRDLDACLATLGQGAGASAGASAGAPPRVHALTTRGDTRHDRVDWLDGDVALFGPESRGLPDHVLRDARIGSLVRLPMRPGMRSLNLSNAIAVVAFEAWRQSDFDGASA